MTNTVISFPIPPYSNLPINPQFFQPNVFFISNILLGDTTIITTSVNQNYVLSQLIKLIIPFKYGCQGLNGRSGYVISIPAPNQVEIDIYSRNIDIFNPFPTFLPFESQTKPQILAVGDTNNGQINSNGRVLNSTIIPGSFINISP